MIRRIKKLIKKVVYHFIPPQVVGSSNDRDISMEYFTYAQAGEDVIIRTLFYNKNLPTIQYLDIGANFPIRCSNTYWFYKTGSTGVCVEADKTLIPELEKVRPNDKVINVGVAVSDESEADFYILNCDGLNTFDKEEALRRQEMGTYKITEVVKVPLVDINTLIKTNFTTYPDLLSIDIEGLDLAVLQSLDFEKYPIPVICVETCTYTENYIKPKDNTIAEFLLQTGYEIYGDTYINTIFVNKNWFYNNKLGQ